MTTAILMALLLYAFWTNAVFMAVMAASGALYALFKRSHYAALMRWERQCRGR